QKAASAGFDWEQKEDVWAKVHEEVAEVEAEVKAGNKEALEGEIGDLLFSIINASRLYGIDPENALERTNKKFMARFSHIEQGAAAQGRSLGDMTLDEMESLWQEAKELR
ncbi:MAG: nucleoside triphosphate pyrophosphohydrolase, partial [Tidjanibacter sp.]|nr:nucleoside triphosphate pyrophosphohydrolase [Tidjanibacter sp.]